MDAAKVVTELERIEYVEDPHLGKGSYCVVERHADGGACSVPDYAVIKLFRHIVQGEGPDTIVREIDEAIQALPEGYDTVCTDGIFSQGEWQLLSIARAAAADPAVLLLDEITANLDAETEARGRTVLSVSHRIYESLGGRTVEIRPQGQ
ncbi:MAG: ATP-binding cassette domain-containing protein [Oscillospiraceae bacterium]